MVAIDVIAVVADEGMTGSVVGGTIAQRKVTRCLLVQAKEQGVSLAGPDGSFSQLMKNVVEIAENVELIEHLGHEHGGALNGREYA